jgi:AcrR family transcriptional regulator
MAAVVAAATELFAERGPAATSIRDVAERCRVNHGLVHRHFGSKEGLVAAVLDQLNHDFVAANDGGEPAAVEDAVSRYLRVLARSILDGYEVGALQHRFPVVAALVQQARPYHREEEAARLAAGHAVALQLGWRLFEPFLRSAAGLQDTSPETLRDTTAAASALLLRSTRPSRGAMDPG